MRDRRLGGVKFVRQASVGPYFADFLCRDHRLIIELDGSQHDDSPHDEIRDRWLTEQGYIVVRFWNADVMLNRQSVVETILAALRRELPGQRATDLKVKIAKV
jgi:very-short-patch-repair endonuclease